MIEKNYKLYPKTINDIENIYLYGCSEFGSKRADSYIKDLETGFHHIANNPEMARNCNYVRSNLKSWCVGSHIIFFKETQKGISILRVLHKSMDYVRHL